MALDLQHIAPLIRQHEELLARIAPGLLDRYPMEEHLALLERYPKIGAYGYVSPAVGKRTGAIRAQAGDPGLQAYHRLLLLHLIRRAPERLPTIRMTEELRALTERDLVRIARTIQEEPDAAFYTYDQDRFQKALAICKLTLIPAGAHKIHLNRLPLRTLLRRNPVTALALVARLGGVQPCYDMHIDSSDPDLLAEYTPEGLSRFYRRAAGMLELFPEVKALIGSAWLFDPEMETVSPHLTYLRLLVTENGGRLLYFGCDRKDLENATRASRTRRRLVREGRYTPRSYLVCWPRQPLLRWARHAG